MLISSLLRSRDRNPVCGRRIMPGASIIGFAVAPHGAAAKPFRQGLEEWSS